MDQFSFARAIYLSPLTSADNDQRSGTAVARRSFSYWGAVILSALLGVLATEKIMGWTPGFRTSTFAAEKVSLIFRGLASYLLGIFSWLLVCSAVGRGGGNATQALENINGQASA